MRPLLGTFFEITTDTDESTVNLAFAEAARLEKIFNLFDPDSEINNAGNSTGRSSEFAEVLALALSLETASNGAFRAQKNGTFDFNGIAKGFIVDSVAQFIQSRDQFCSGSISAGGDLLLFNQEPKKIMIRLGTPSLPVYRELLVSNKGVATSAGAFSALSGSSTRYDEKTGLSATVVAPTCVMADALTKVALFAEAEILKKCARQYRAQFLLFDDYGSLVSCYGENETQ